MINEMYFIFSRPMLELHDDEKEEVRHDMAAQPRFIEVQKGKISLAPSSVVVVESPKNTVSRANKII